MHSRYITGRYDRYHRLLSAESAGNVFFLGEKSVYVK